jgi:hypothetical protein
MNAAGRLYWKIALSRRANWAPLECAVAAVP